MIYKDKYRIELETLVGRHVFHGGRGGQALIQNLGGSATQLGEYLGRVVEVNGLLAQESADQ